LSERKQSVTGWPQQAGLNTVMAASFSVPALILRKAGLPPFATLLVKLNINNQRPRLLRAHARRDTMVSPPEIVPAENRSRETRVFVFLTVVLAPLLAVAIVGSYGLLIWLYQMLMGPPKG
jgi:periplasmic nitrate reductase NapE